MSKTHWTISYTQVEFAEPHHMLELLLKLLEKFGTLVELRGARKRRAFKEMAEPMFNELLEVHSDYISHFTEALSIAEQTPHDPVPAIKYLEKARTKLEPIQVKLAALAKNLQPPKNPSVMDAFLMDVARYFPVGDVNMEEGSASTSLIRELKRLLPEATRRPPPPILFALEVSSPTGTGKPYRKQSNTPKRVRTPVIRT